MPLAILLNVAPTPGEPAWWRREAALSAVIYALLEAGDERISARWHGVPGLKPFTIATLEHAGAPAIRLTALTEDTEEALTAGVARVCTAGVWRLEDKPIRFGQFHTGPPPLAQRLTYAEITQTRRGKGPAGIRFATPTTFSQGGDRHLPLPLPDRIVNSWADRWNLFAPEDLRIEEKTVTALIGRLGLGRARIEADLYSLKAGKIAAFTGRVELYARHIDAWPAEESAAWTALLAYSRFCGTGAHTARGMGLTLPD